MSVQKGMNRRDFLRNSGLAAISLPVIRKVGGFGGHTFYKSAEEYGGFFIKKRDRDDPPYQVDEAVYQRFDAKNCIFGRMGWDPKIQEQQEGIVPLGQPGDPGWRREDEALHAAAGMLAAYNGTNASTPAAHTGLLQLEPIGATMTPPADVLKQPWDHSHLSDEGISEIVKKAAKFLGASLVGIAALDERWVYSHYYDTFGEGSAPILFAPVEEVQLPEGQVSAKEAEAQVRAQLEAMDPEALKAFIVDTLSGADPGLMPPGSPSPKMMGAMPADQFKQVLPMMMSSLPTAVIALMAAGLGLDFEIAIVDPGESAKPRYLDDRTLVIPETMNRVVVMAFEMDHDAIQAYPSPEGMAAATNGYARMTFTAASLAEFIRHLGYNAIPCGNNTGLSVPMAIDAGLGELGRQGILITPKYGPRVRLAKVITDLPLAADQPISFGVKEFCDVCGKCAEKCPSQAILAGPQTTEPTTISTNPGVMKWPIDAERCFAGWTMSGGDCGNCIRVCPFTKQEGWLHDATKILIGAESGALDSLLLNLDDASGYGGEPDYDLFWKSDNYIHIKS